MKFVKLFEPLTIKGNEIKNRIVMPAMHMNYSDDGSMNDAEINFYEERAKGGVGLIIIGGCAVEMRGAAPSMIRVDDDKYIPGLTNFAETIHKYGTKVIAQLYHAGRYAFSFVSNETPVSASAIYSNFSKETPEELTIEEIKKIITRHADSAERVKKAGFEGVELLGSAGYLINQFLSPVTNKRIDEYGGSLENRLRYPLELIKAVKERVGDNFIVGIRVSGDDFVPGSNTYVENAQIAKKYAEAGIDYINVTGGWHETRVPQITSQVPQGAYAYLAENIRKEIKQIGGSASNIPVFVGNRINDPIIAEEILRDNKADAVCMGRALIADPYIVNKTKEGKIWDIMRCVACNQGCFDHVFKMKPIECLRNFTVSREGRYNLDVKAQDSKKVLIIGAGPAGLEAARVATLRGHKVTIMEKRNEIGGQVNVSFVPHGRESLKSIIQYYKDQILHLNIDLRLGVEATPEIIKSFGADIVFFGTGVKYSIPPIEGIDGSLGSDIVFADDALAGEQPVGQNVVVVGGAATGVETAIWAAKLGALSPETAYFLNFYKALPTEEINKRWFKGSRNVTILEMLPRIGSSIGKSSRWVMIDELKHLDIDVITNARITKFEGKTVHYLLNDEEKTMTDIDTFILATGVKPNADLYNEIKATKPGFKMIKIGDCKKPQTIMDAIHEGFKRAYKL